MKLQLKSFDFQQIFCQTWHPYWAKRHRDSVGSALRAARSRPRHQASENSKGWLPLVFATRERNRIDERKRTEKRNVSLCTRQLQKKDYITNKREKFFNFSEIKYYNCNNYTKILLRNFSRWIHILKKKKSKDINERLKILKYTRKEWFCWGI